MTSPEEIAKLIETTVRADLSGIQGNGGSLNGNSVKKRILDPKGMSRVDTFSGKDSQWREWAFQLRVAIKAMDAEVADIMSRCEADEAAHKLEDLELEFESLSVTKVAGELYDILCLCLTGDPLILVQGVISMNGFEAWGKLYRHCRQ